MAWLGGKAQTGQNRLWPPSPARSVCSRWSPKPHNVVASRLGFLIKSQGQGRGGCPALGARLGSLPDVSRRNPAGTGPRCLHVHPQLRKSLGSWQGQAGSFGTSGQRPTASPDESCWGLPVSPGLALWGERREGKCDGEQEGRERRSESACQDTCTERVSIPANLAMSSHFFLSDSPLQSH